jgi:predicted Rossmann fold nucleotide-binding protein DprA/Smf involved in DNA uptake
MKIQKELVKISKDLEKISREIQKLTSSITKEKGKAQKASMPKPVAPNKSKKSGTQTVLDMIKKSKKGIGTETLINKTGFDGKKIHNTLFKALKEGKIERVGRGVYKSSK